MRSKTLGEKSGPLEISLSRDESRRMYRIFHKLAKRSLNSEGTRPRASAPSSLRLSLSLAPPYVTRPAYRSLRTCQRASRRGSQASPRNGVTNDSYASHETGYYVSHVPRSHDTLSRPARRPFFVSHRLWCGNKYAFKGPLRAGRTAAGRARLVADQRRRANPKPGNRAGCVPKETFRVSKMEEETDEASSSSCEGRSRANSEFRSRPDGYFVFRVSRYCFPAVVNFYSWLPHLYQSLSRSVRLSIPAV